MVDQTTEVASINPVNGKMSLSRQGATGTYIMDFSKLNIM